MDTHTHRLDNLHNLGRGLGASARELNRVIALMSYSLKV